MKRISRIQLKWLIENLDVIDAYGEIYLDQAKAFTKQIDALAYDLRYCNKPLRSLNKNYYKLVTARQKYLDSAREFILIARQVDTIFTKTPKTYKEALYIYITTGDEDKAYEKCKEFYEYTTKKSFWKNYYNFLNNITATTTLNGEKIEEIQKIINNNGRK